MTLTLLLLTCSAFGQSSITITPKKTNYTRKGVEAHRRNVSVRYPIVGGAIKPAVKTKLENTISYWRNFETTLKESLSDTWLSSLDYKVNYNQNGILDISLTQEGVGAYPDSQTVNLVIDLRTGEQVKFADVFKSDSLAKLAEMVDKKLQAEKQQIMQQIDKGEYGTSQDEKTQAKEIIADLKFTAEDFKEFSVNDKGVTFLYDAGFPHATEALQPEGRYFFSYTELKAFIKPESVLGQFVR